MILFSNQKATINYLLINNEPNKNHANPNKEKVC